MAKYKFNVGDEVKTSDGKESTVQFREPVGSRYSKDNAYFLHGINGSYKERELRKA